MILLSYLLLTFHPTASRDSVMTNPRMRPGTKGTVGSSVRLPAFKWSSRRDSNPHVALTSRCTAGARVLRVARSGSVQFTVQPHVVQNKSFESRQGQTSRVLARSIKSPLSNVVLHVPTAISPALPDRCTIWHSAFAAHGSTWFGGELHPLPLKAGRVCHFPPRDVCSKVEIACGGNHRRPGSSPCGCGESNSTVATLRGPSWKPESR